MNETHQEEAISQKYQDLTKIMGQYAALNNQFISIFNTKSQRVLYMSSNYLDMLGYKCGEEDYIRWSTV